MLTFLAFSMIIVFMALVMTGRATALIALIVVPIVFALIGGFGGSIGPMVISGLRSIAPTGVLLLFAILYFGLMIDVGLFDPLIRLIVRLSKGDPVRIVVGSALLAMIVSLDGDGSTTYLLCVTAMLPLHRRLGINPLILPCVTMMGNSIMNIAPWGGPTARVMSALHLEANQVFIPLIPSMAMACLATAGVAWYLGLKERARLKKIEWKPEHLEASPIGGDVDLDASDAPRSSKAMMVFNLLLTIALMTCLVLAVLPLPLLFMGAFAIAISVNFPSIKDQKERIAAHSASALSVVSVIFAAGVFTGILSGTKMTDAIAQSVVSAIPGSAGHFLPLITALLSAPMTFFLSNDAFYFGVVPILAEAAKGYGIAPEIIARASLLGQPIHQLSPLVAANYVLMGVAGVEFGDHQKFTLKWAALLVAVMILSAGLFGIVPLF
ncbi:citrate:proton symporter [Variovorax sp. NFACC27]|uniref:CitMHS family transporter n=1 Tax=unclassified Variovorax TaxID=663243 RepID=UPI00089B6D8C|nr:citrate-Mg2+:H+ or citrate-Ca2+:H+ symporter, CitMHS family [Variovorax sp. NFACC28]SEG70091.1 citrate-Mg2+:H+ or citrate-Ca2+:H+ symporter, CitMHS family [Variovorax sp. NFACC29]SFC83313.1 citrate-Mg2+:H+ or citrate-Ca2+:H+ symporter, CitMHS family [Variovorax sp. NFACC26]SFF98009.1 citrate-Mg2+:H+ or citrate-Ca2+:H+ symporter, CitMHS family [Variovorax sp. NFACC27]